MSDEQADFEFQLQAEKESTAAAAPVASSSQLKAGQYVDPKDGTIYEWDHSRKGWFPKVGVDFGVPGS